MIYEEVFTGESVKAVMEVGQGKGKSSKGVILGKIWKRGALAESCRRTLAKKWYFRDCLDMTKNLGFYTYTDQSFTEVHSRKI